MKNYREEEKTTIHSELISVTCDKCGKETPDLLDFQEWLYIDFVGGYASIFGDFTKVQAEICQECLLEIIGGFCRKEELDPILQG
ncbi:MAG: hypothetical protein KAS04_06660 [Candidatus Aenigmarchaeota archaeon]|nr:hypothetical protein [Candidatus Aenigmarchaeota archaeon]